MTLPVDAFSELVAAFSELLGHPRADGVASSGFEFEADAHVLRCLPHPGDPARCVVEADVCTIGPSDQHNAALLLMLHQLNEASALLTGWTLLIDTEMRVLVQRTLALEGLTALQLEADLAQALERAQALRQLIDRYLQARQQDRPSPGLAELALPLGMQRA